MEQSVWLAFGVIAVLIGFAIVASLIMTNREESRYITFKSSMEKLGNQCDLVCDSPLDTYLAVNVELPSGLRLEARDDKICGNLNISEEYDDENKCVICKCTVSMNGTFDLQTEIARKSFSTHKYACYFNRKENEIQMECKG
jgi:hypothetical protein